MEIGIGTMSSDRVRRLVVALKEEIAKFTIENRDKEDVVVALQHKIQQQRGAVNALALTQQEHYGRLVEMENKALEDGLEMLELTFKKFGDEKLKSLSECQQLVERIGSVEADIGNAIRKLNKEIELAIHNGKSSFRDGYEERLQRFLSLKSAEVREATMNAMQPEISRLQQLHRKELADVELSFQTKESNLRQDFVERIKRTQAELRAILRDDHKDISMQVSTSLQSEIEELENSHARRLKQLESELENEYEEVKTMMETRNDKERRRYQNSLRTAQECAQTRLQELRAKHEQEILDLNRVSHNVLPKSFTIGTLEDEDANEIDIRLIDSEMGAINRERDRRIQLEIKQLQVDLVKFEKKIFCASEKQKKEIEEIEVEELALLRRRQIINKDNLSNYLLQLEDLSRQEETLKLAAIEREFQLSSLQKECSVYEDGIRVYDLRAYDGEQELVQLRTIEERHVTKAGDGHAARISRLQQELVAKKKAADDHLKSLEVRHNKALDELNSKVRTDIKRLDEEISEVTECIQIESVKLRKLEELVTKYTGRP